jgi:hypothetical protein
MIIGIAILLLIYLITITANMIRTNRMRRKLKPGDECFIYYGELKTKVYVLGISKEIEVKIFNEIINLPRKLIYA